MKRCMGCMEEYDDTKTFVCPHCGYVAGSMPEVGNQLVAGSVLKEKYIVGKSIGSGGFGVTYIGYDSELGRKVAIKEYLPGEFSGRVQGQAKVTIYDGDRAEQFQAGLERFAGEAKRLAQFSNVPGIVQIYDSFVENNTAYIIMEYLDGETLKEKIEREKKLSFKETMDIMLPIISSLRTIHKIGIVHRDIAPDNIMITKSGEAKLIDFGASRFATATHSRSLTVLIKQGYAPVEQYNSRGEQGTWTDVYAAAATIYKAITGKTPQDAMERKMHDELKPPSKEGAKVNKNIDNAIMNALNLNIKYRTQNMYLLERNLTSTESVIRIDEPKERKDVGKTSIGLKIFAGVAAAVIIIFTALLLTGRIPLGEAFTSEFTLGEKMTFVPSFVNQTYTKAGELAEDNDVTIQVVDSVYSSEIPQDMVCAQDYASGTEVEKMQVINLTVSAGLKLSEMPSLIGLTENEAKILLENEELKYEVVEVFSNMNEGAIVSQSIEEGERITPGTVVTIEISKGINPENEFDSSVKVDVPNFSGRTLESAIKEMDSLKVIADVKSEYSTTVEKGKIISQSPRAGSEIHQGDTVAITMSLGKQVVYVPYVQAKSEAEARQLLSDKNLKVSVSYEYNDTFKQGNVISQSIEANTQVNAGTLVALVVSSGKQQTTWSDWMTSLPGGINATNAEIETQYRYRDMQTMTSADSSLSSQGWELVNTQNTYGDYGVWSAWGDSFVQDTETRQTETQTLYQYRQKQTATSSNSSMSGWTNTGSTKSESVGNWSEWSRNAVAASEDSNGRTEVETRTGQEDVVTGKRYRYYHYYGPSGKYWNGYTVYYTYSSTFFGSSGIKETMYLDYYVPTNGASSWYTDSSGQGWWYEGEENVTGTNTYTEYRSRYVAYNYTYTFEKMSDWSSWSTSAVSSSDTVEVNTKTQYRYRDRQVTYNYTYRKWGDYSSWSDTYASPSSTRDVETRYRYRSK